MLAGIVARSADLRSQCLHQGVVISALAILAEAPAHQHRLVRAEAVRFLAAVSRQGEGAAPGGSAAKEDESSASGASPAPTLRVSGRKASGLTTAGASTRSVGSESSVDVGDVMRLILSPLWTSPATRLGVLQGAAADPLAAVDLYDSSITEPMMVWNEPLRADIRKFLDDEWRAIESWHLAHPTEPLKYPVHTLQSRVSIPAAASQFVVHGVFVHVFNEDKSTRGLDLLDFVQALLQYLKEAFEKVCANDSDEQALTNCMGAWSALGTVFGAGAVPGVEESGVPKELAAQVACFVVGSVSPVIIGSVFKALAATAKHRWLQVALEAGGPGVVTRLVNAFSLIRRHPDSGESGDPIVDVFGSLAALASGSPRLCKLLLDCGLLLYCVFAIVGTGGDPDDAVAVNAAEALSALCRDTAVGARAMFLCADLTTGEFLRHRVGERRVPLMLQYFSSDHEDSVNSRQWGAAPRQRLMTFLTAQTGALEASMASDVAGPCAWTGAASRWDPSAVRSLHPGAISNATE